MMKRVFIFLLLIGIVVPAAAFAQDSFGIEAAGRGTILGQEDLILTITRIISYALAILGIIAVGIVLYAGYLYMTAGGNEDQVDRAKKMLINGAIGLAIIFSSYAIAAFVINRLSLATGAGGGGLIVNCQDPLYAAANPRRCAPGNFSCEENRTCCTAEQFVVLAITPSSGPGAGTPTGMNNIRPRAIFSQPVASDIPADQVFRIERDGNNVSSEFSFSYVNVDRRVIEAVPRAVPSLASLGAYIVTIEDNVRAEGGDPLVESVPCGFFPQTASFVVDTTGVTDIVPPAPGALTINGSPQLDIMLPRGRTYDIESAITDDHGVGYSHLQIIRESDNATVVSYDGPPVERGSAAPGGNPYAYLYTLIIPRNAATLERYRVVLTVLDIDNNQWTVQGSYVVVGEHCDNNVRDGDETDIDFGGSCLGNGACTANWQCFSGRCDLQTNQCVASPVIADVNAWDGAAGNWITISGRYFGEEIGEVAFAYDANQNDAIDDAEWRDAGLAACGSVDVWHDQYIIVEVPEDVIILPGSRSAIRVRHEEFFNDPTFFDTTINNIGPISGPNNGYFTKNSTRRPGLCALFPAAGTPEMDVTVRGNGLGASQSGSDILFGGVEARATAWTDAVIETSIPRNLNAGRVAVSARVSGEFSNGILFEVQAEGADLLPLVESIDPGVATRRSFVTIYGRRFGEIIGRVFFAAADATCPGDPSCLLVPSVDIPMCGDTWTDTQIVIEVPDTASIATHAVIIENASGYQSDGQVPLTIFAGAPLPSICRLTPDSGPSPLPEGESVILTGRNFTNTTNAYFWTVGSDPNDLVTWLLAAGPQNSQGPIFDRTVAGDMDTIRTLIPVSTDGYSMQTGPIRVQSAEGDSNSVRYTVADCREAPPDSLPGFQCCQSTGQWRDDQFICPGETRDAGYGYRFTTGRIPRLPYVVQNCQAPEDGQPVVFPSPTPWRGDSANLRPQGEGACVNATIAVRFSMSMDDTTLIANNLRLFACGTDEEPDCDNVVDVLDPMSVISIGNVLYIRQAPPDLLGNTWYRVVLLDGIESQEVVSVLGVDRTVNQPLLHTRPCGTFGQRESAYCFEFKTGSAGTRCALDGVGIQRPNYTVHALGPLLDPRYPAGNTVPFYYYLWGRGSQECTVIPVNGLGWNWTTSDARQATVRLAPGGVFTDTRATGDALLSTAPASVEIRADATVDGQAHRGLSLLTIDIGDPEVIEFWPNCQEACVNATVGVRFNRPMYVPDLATNIRLYRCPGETCFPNGAVGNPLAMPVPLTVLRVDELVLEASPQSQLAENTWYQLEVVGQVRAIGGFNASGESIPGPVLIPFFSTFRTKADNAFCTASRVVVEPDPFVAYSIGEKTIYTALPLGSPDACSALGQRLSALDFGWSWSTPDVPGQEVATVSNFSFYGRPKSYCTTGCLVQGSDIPTTTINFGVCGNGIVDPGEDCDIAMSGEISGRSCTYSCLRPGGSTLTCGNDIVEPLAGEECDTTDINTEAFCADNCTWTGSGVFTATPGAPSCNSGNVTNGEDCEIGLDGNTVFTCSAQCLHLGTLLAQSWCDDFGGSQTADVCASAISMCGNDIVEADEECEVVGGFVEVMVPSINQGSPQTFIQQRTNASVERCSAHCVLSGDICGTSIPDPLRCATGSEGCSAGCTLLGASVGYSASSLCGDGRTGIGEFQWCEYTADEVTVGNISGQNPTQAVTAVGQGIVDPQTRQQMTEVQSSAVAERRDNAAPVAINNPPIGSGDYALQCGYTEYTNPQDGPLNDCRNSAHGVGTNSCCYPRPARVESYPEDGAGLLGGPSGDVCRNTYISFTFDQAIDEATLFRNFYVAEGHAVATPDYDCVLDGGREVTAEVNGTLTSDGVLDRGFFARVWDAVKTFVLRLFGLPVNASLFRDANIEVWCTGSVRVVPSLRYEEVVVNSIPETHTVVELPITQLLDGNTLYAVFVRGGNSGVKDIRGVAVLYDSILFETGNEICKLESVIIEPPEAFYNAPNTSTVFIASASSTNGQVIVPIDNQYDWNWSWGPATHPVFTVPADIDTAITVSSNAVEGTMTLVANAEVTADVDQQNNHFGRTFSGSSQLTALFCENPWPPRDYYPYEDGNPPNRMQTNDGYNNGFDGSELPPVLVDSRRVYFNFSMGYCADAGRSGDTSDDLYLRPLLLGNLASDTRAIVPRRVGRLQNNTGSPPAQLLYPLGIVYYANHVFTASFLSDLVQVVNVSNNARPVAGSVIRNAPAQGVYLDEPQSLTLFDVPNRPVHLVVLSHGANPAVTFINITNPTNAVAFPSFVMPQSPSGDPYLPLSITFSADGGRAYLGMQDPDPRNGSIYDALAILDTTDLSNILLITRQTQTQFSTAYGATDSRAAYGIGYLFYSMSPGSLEMVGNNLYVVSRELNYLTVFDVRGDVFDYVDIGLSQNLGSFLINPTAIVRSPDNLYLYVLSLENGFGILDVSDPRQPRTVSAMQGTPFAPNYFNRGGGIAVSNGILYITESIYGRGEENSFSAVDVTNPDTPIFLGKTIIGQPSGSPTGIDVNGVTVYLSLIQEDGIEIYDASSPGATAEGGTISGALKQFLFVNEQNDDAIGIQIFDNTSPPRTTKAPGGASIAAHPAACGYPYCFTNIHGTDSWFEGQLIPVSWTNPNLAERFSAGLFDMAANQTEVRAFQTGILNDGAENIMLPNAANVLSIDPVDGQYRLDFAREGVGGVEFFSQPFRLRSRLRMEQPTGLLGERASYWVAGSQQTMSWTGGGEGWGLTLELHSVTAGLQYTFSVGGRIQLDPQGVPRGSAQVTVPRNITPGQYFVRVVCLDRFECGSEVDGFEMADSIAFTIIEPAPPATIVVPPPAGIGPASGRDDVRLSVREWYERRFGPVPSRFRMVTVDGYEALTDGSAYYVHMLNVGSTGEIFNNIIVFSLNPDAQEGTRRVFDALLNSLAFNINITDHGYCSVGDTNVYINTPDTDPSIACVTDFDCSDVEGEVRICANAQTKLQRDVDRLMDIRQAQKNIASYRAQTASYPGLRSGTFIPAYSLSRWPSWGRLGSIVGALPTDPVNEWSACVSSDQQTCWNAIAEPPVFVCPNRSQIYEYRSIDDGRDYVLHSSFEYLNGQREIVGDLIDRSHFVDQQYCIPNQSYSPFQASCGDGVVNIGEECDPPRVMGSSRVGLPLVNGLPTPCASDERASAQCSTSCRITYGRCESGCGNGIVETDLGEICDDGALNGNYGRCGTTCLGPSARYCGNTSGAVGRPPTAETPDEFCEKGDDIYDEVGFCRKQSCINRRYTFFDQSIVGVGAFQGSHFINTSTGWAVGTRSGPLRGVVYNYNGTNWAEQLSLPDAVFWDVFFLNSSYGWAVGQLNDMVMIRTTNGGRTWSVPITIPGSNGAFSAVYFLSENRGFAVGDRGGLIADTNDGGRTWRNQSLSTAGFRDIQFVNASIGWIVGTGGTILKTIDGGENWRSQTSGVTTELQAVYFLNPFVGWAVGRTNTILRTVDGGTTWTSGLGTPALIGGDFFDVYFLTEQIGVIANYGPGRIYTTNNGGASWAVQPGIFASGNDIFMVSTIRGWVFGNAGSVWQMDIDPYCTEITDCTVNGSISLPCQNNDTCVAVADATYHARNPQMATGSQGSSCSLDCQAHGGFCGDGVTQPDYEECDDGNTVDTDACTNFCFTRVAVSADRARQDVECGNNIVQTGEACDLGVSNGVVCVPTYGRACTYCSEFCTQALTVDPIAYCGNGMIDQIGVDDRGNAVREPCDQGSQGIGEIVVPNGTLSCDGSGERGDYQCTDSCTRIVDNCIICGLKSLASGGAVPQIRVANMMVGETPLQGASLTNPLLPDISVSGWRPQASLYMGNTRIAGPVALDISAPFGTIFNLLTGNGIETDLRCSPYGLRFEGLSSGFLRGLVSYSFPFVVGSQRGVVTNEFLFVPPTGYWDGRDFRIVVRWTDEEMERGAEFSGMVYNTQFSGIDQGKMYGYTRALGSTDKRICDQMWRWEGFNGHYWATHFCPQTLSTSGGNENHDYGFENASVLIRPMAHLSTISAHMVDINAGGRLDTIDQPYAFFVDAISQSIGVYRDSSLTVEVYQNARSDNSLDVEETLSEMYAPIATFEIRRVAGTSVNPATDEYWHVFNLVKNPQTDVWGIERFGPLGTDGERHGSIESGFQGVLDNIR